MTEKIETDAEEFNALKKIGLELENPQDEFSYQPDSGGTANGAIGKLEYGIDVDLDAQGRELADDGSNATPEDFSIPIPGESEWSQKNRLPEDELGDYSSPEDERNLVALIKIRLSEHPILKRLPVSITAQSGLVRLSGTVRNDATKILFREVISEVSGVMNLENNLSVITN